MHIYMFALFILFELIYFLANFFLLVVITFNDVFILFDCYHFLTHFIGFYATILIRIWYSCHCKNPDI